MEMDDEQARRHFRAGRELYAAGRFALAAEEFAEAHRLSNRPELLYNMYLAYRDANAAEHAADALRRYLASNSDVADRQQLEARLQSLEATLAEQRAQDRQREMLQMETQRLREQREAELRQREEARRAREAEGASIVPWLIVGGGGLLVVAGSVTGAISLSATSEVEDACNSETKACPGDFDLEGERNQAQSLALVTDILMVAGVAAIGTGIVLAVIGSGDEEEDISASAACTRTGCAASIGGRF